MSLSYGRSGKRIVILFYYKEILYCNCVALKVTVQPSFLDFEIGKKREILSETVTTKYTDYNVTKLACR